MISKSETEIKNNVRKRILAQTLPLMVGGMGCISRRGLLLVTFFVTLGVAGTTSAEVINLPLSEFVVFSHSGLPDVGGHNLIIGNIGSNAGYSQVGNSQILGSVYVGGDLTVGSNVAFGSDGLTASPDLQSGGRYTSPDTYPAQLAKVVVNGFADFGGSTNAALATRIYGNVYTNEVFLRTNVGISVAGSLGGGNLEYTGTMTDGFNFNSGATVEGTVNGVSWGPATSGTNPPGPTPLASTKTFGGISMTSGVSFTATGDPQQVGGTNFLELPTGPSTTYGSLSTSATGQTVRLSSGDYYFSSITAQGNFTLEIDLTSGTPIDINVVGDATFSQDTVLKVKGAGTGGLFVPISDAPELASLINWTLGGTFDLGGGDDIAWTTIFGGIVYSAFFDDGAGTHGIIIDQRVDWYGALYAYDTINLADHSRFNYVIPEPSSAILFLSCLIGLSFTRIGWREKKKG